MKQDENGIYYYQIYEPHDSGNNLKFNKETGGLILDMKEGRGKALKLFTERLTSEIAPFDNKKEVLFVCPSTSRAGISRLVQNLGKEFWVEVKTDLFYHFSDEGLKHQSSDGNMSNMMKTLKIRNVNLDGKKKIVIFDDITNSGTTLLACKKLLEEKGDFEIILIAVGKTAE